MNYTEIEMEGMKEILRDKEEEIKKLNEKLLWNEEIFIKSDNDFKYWFKKARELMEENDKLKEEIKKLNEKIRFLEQCLDNKEKVNLSMREELQRYKEMWDSGEF